MALDQILKMTQCGALAGFMFEGLVHDVMASQGVKTLNLERILEGESNVGKSLRVRINGEAN